ncbi:hypothetical protein HWI79_631 [Cryptosporidium felis]|nr:hypothetical protein HWI79_631 [Cryptosporidium felis]
MSARARNLRANKNSTIGGNKTGSSKESPSSIKDDYYRRFDLQPAVMETPMSPRTAKWVRELTPVLEPYNFNLNEISDLIRRCHYDAGQIELAVGNVIEDFSGHESGQWTKVGKNRSGDESKPNSTNNVNNKNRNPNTNHSNKGGKQIKSNFSQTPSHNHAEGNNTGNSKSTGNKAAKHTGNNNQNQVGVLNQVAKFATNNVSKGNTLTSSTPVTNVSTFKANISNNPVDGSTTWAKLARRNNSNAKSASLNHSNGNLAETSATTISVNCTFEENSDPTDTKEQDPEETTVVEENQHNRPVNSSLKSYKHNEDHLPNILVDDPQSSPPAASTVSSSNSTGSGITAIDLGIKVGGISPPHGIQIGNGFDRSSGIGVYLPEGRTVDMSANEGLLFGSFGAVDISKIPENQVQINSSIIPDTHNSPTTNTNLPATSYNTNSLHSSGFGVPATSATSIITGSESNTGICSSGVGNVPGGHLLNGWGANSSSPTKESSANSIIVDQGLLHQPSTQRTGGVSGGSTVSGSGAHSSMKSSGIGGGYMGHSIAGNTGNNYSTLQIGSQSMTGSGSYSSNQTLLSGSNGVNYGESMTGNGSSSNSNGTGNNSGGNGSNMALAAAAAAAAAAATNPYNYAYLNYAGYTANFPYIVGNTAAFGFPHYNTKPNGHHHPGPVFNQYSQVPNPGQHSMNNGVYGMSGAGGAGSGVVNNSTGNVVVSDNVGVNYHPSSQSPMTVGGGGHGHHINTQSQNSYQNIQSMHPQGMGHQQISIGNQQPGSGGNSLQTPMNLPIGFNNSGVTTEFGVEQGIPQTVFLGQAGPNNNKLDNIGSHPGDFIHQGYSSHHAHISNPASNPSLNSQGNPNSGNQSAHAKGGVQGPAGNFQGNIQFVGKPTSSAPNTGGAGTPSATNGNSGTVNTSPGVSGATVGGGIELSHQGQGVVGGSSGSGNPGIFLSGRPQNAGGQNGQVGPTQPKQTSVNFTGFHSSRANNNTGFLQHNNNMWNNS